jgi:membrane protease YdiL (CAAX protease family)
MPGAGPFQTAAGVVALVVFAAFTEELLFRGLLQSIAIETFGIWRLGLTYAAAMSAVMYLGSGSLPYTIAVGAYGLLLGATIVRGGSLWGAIASHGLAIVGMAFVWPFMVGSG